MKILNWITFALVSAPLAQGQRSTAPKRPATIDDLLARVEAPEQIAVSPDSAWVAVTIGRPQLPGERYRDAVGFDRTDIWLFSSDGRVRRNLTLGKADASGWWEPVWSPDGQHLGMLSTRGRDGNIKLYVWNRRRDQLTLATTRGVSPRLALQLPRYQREAYCSWLHAPFAHYGWSSDTALVFLALPRGTNGEWHDLTEMPRRAEKAWALVERGTASTASVLDAGPGVPPDSFAPLELSQVVLPSHATTTLAAISMGDYRELARYARYPAAATISPDGRTLALLVTEPMANWPASSLTAGCCYVPGLRLGLIALDSRRPARWVTLDSTGFFGTDGRTSELRFDNANCGGPRAQWASDGRTVLVHVTRAAAAEDHWYRVPVEGSVTLVSTEAPAPTAADTASPPPSMLTVRTSQGVSNRYDLVLHGRDTVMTLNGGEDQLDAGRKIAISYRGVDGDSLIALLALPLGYTPGRRYPMITVVYHSAIEHADDTVPSMADALWAAHGYLVLYPTMPPANQGHGVSDVFVDLSKGVFPAIDRAIELGYADPSRLAVKGASFGGFSTYALTAYSDRFKAAIVENGPTDWISYYGTFYAQFRYRDTLSWPMSGDIPSQVQLGGPPWADLERYIKNSPLTWVDRIHTPVMIIEGDQDPAVPTEQAEEMFTALYRLGRRVELVRYWGEAHWNVSPANIRDEWEREIKWFDTYLKSS